MSRRTRPFGQSSMQTLDVRSSMPPITGYRAGDAAVRARTVFYLKRDRWDAAKPASKQTLAKLGPLYRRNVIGDTAARLPISNAPKVFLSTLGDRSAVSVDGVAEQEVDQSLSRDLMVGGGEGHVGVPFCRVATSTESLPSESHLLCDGGGDR